VKKLTALMLTLAAVCILVTPVAAGERAGAFSLSPFAGGYTFDGVQHLETAPVFGLRLGYDLTKNWGVELVGDYLATKGTLSNGSINALSYRLDILYNFMADGPLVPYLAVGGGGITGGHGSDGFKISGRTTDATANAGFGIKYFLTESIALRGDARQLFLFEEHNSVMYNWEYTAGLTFLFGGKTAPAPVPPPAPTSSLSVNPGSVTKGETATLSWTSQDTTNCDITPGVGSVRPQGSMTITPASDTTYSLSCSGPGGTTSSTANVSVVVPPPPALKADLTVTPASITQGQTAKLAWTAQNATNCGIQPDIGTVQPQGNMDITPAADTAYTLTCTGPSGTASSVANVSVVMPPPPAPVVLNPEKEETVNLLIEFDFNKAVIKPEFYQNVNAVGEFMQKYPSVHLTVEGHTDNVGAKAYNQKLSQRRAEAVKKYIVDNFGIDAQRIRAVGYGETRPVASNKTAEGRYKNRRVQAYHAGVK
jgi:OOP family OmpA-OmpF porin